MTNEEIQRLIGLREQMAATRVIDDELIRENGRVLIENYWNEVNEIIEEVKINRDPCTKSIHLAEIEPFSLSGEAVPGYVEIRAREVYVGLILAGGLRVMQTILGQGEITIWFTDRKNQNNWITRDLDEHVLVVSAGYEF